MAEVPTATSLKDIYTDDAVESQIPRWESLLAAFKKEYGHPADFVSRSPGRLNIIGEVGFTWNNYEYDLTRPTAH